MTNISNKSQNTHCRVERHATELDGEVDLAERLRLEVLLREGVPRRLRGERAERYVRHADELCGKGTMKAVALYGSTCIVFHVVISNSHGK